MHRENQSLFFASNTLTILQLLPADFCFMYLSRIPKVTHEKKAPEWSFILANPHEDLTTSKSIQWQNTSRKYISTIFRSFVPSWVMRSWTHTFPFSFARGATPPPCWQLGVIVPLQKNNQSNLTSDLFLVFDNSICCHCPVVRSGRDTTAKLVLFVSRSS